jgi:hypothetical protein
MTTYKEELSRCLDIIEARLDSLNIPGDANVPSPDDTTSFAFCQIVRIFDERLGEIESKLEIKS